MTKKINKDEDIKIRIEGFKGEYAELTKKYQVELSVYPIFLPTPNGTFQISVNAQIVDTKYINEQNIIPEVNEPVIKE